MTEVTTNEVKKFLRQYRKATFPTQFGRLRMGYEDVLRESRKTSPRFNVFHVLGVGRREVKTHSALLADLLNPVGTHEHRFLFLNAFFHHCQENISSLQGRLFPKLPDNFEEYEWDVRKERGATEYGRMDIVIQCKELGFLCVIENKVGRFPGIGEGEQLAAYWHWMQKECEDSAGQALLFLTPDWRAAKTDPEIDYFKIDYKNNIYTWLTDTYSKVESTLVKTVIKQYTQLILTL